MGKLRLKSKLNKVVVCAAGKHAGVGGTIDNEAACSPAGSGNIAMYDSSRDSIETLSAAVDLTDSKQDSPNLGYARLHICIALEHFRGQAAAPEFFFVF